MPITKKHIFAFCLLFIYVCIGIYLHMTTHPDITHQTGDAYSTYEKGRIVQILDEDVSLDESIANLWRGSQDLHVEVLTGSEANSYHDITNYLSATHSVLCKVGDIVILKVDHSDSENYTVTVYNYNRETYLWGLLGLFVLVVLLVGRWKGLRAILGVAFGLLSIIYILLPLIYRGFSPIPTAIFLSLTTTFFTLFLLNGACQKTYIAIAGTCLGVILAGIISSVFGSLAHVSGLQTDSAESLIVLSDEQGLQIQGLLFASILISSLGAVIDVAMSLSSALCELKDAQPLQKGFSLFASGIRIGQDMIGTMINTLIFAFTGSSLNTLLLLYGYNTSYRQILNMDFMSIQILQSIAGSIGLVLTVPITAFIAASLLTTPSKTLKKS